MEKLTIDYLDGLVDKADFVHQVKINGITGERLRITSV